MIYILIALVIVAIPIILGLLTLLGQALPHILALFWRGVSTHTERPHV